MPDSTIKGRTNDSVSAGGDVLGGLDALVPGLEAIYKDLHAHPELSLQETRTAAIAAAQLTASGYQVTTDIGGKGVVGVLVNGDGPTVMLRADMDALPVCEETGVDYASTASATVGNDASVPVMHACGHDMHVTCLIGAARLMAASRDAWRGTLMVLFQPAEELVSGAQSMVDDDKLKQLPRPDVVLGQHVMVGPAGTIRTRPGVFMAASDDVQIRLFGKGAHGSMPEASVDPVVLAASTVLRLQTIVSREMAPADRVTLTVGVLHAGSAPNVIPDDALIQLDIRTFDNAVREKMLTAIKRISHAEAAASGVPRTPEITLLNSAPQTENDPDATRTLMHAFSQHFAPGCVHECDPVFAGEDFGQFGSAYGVPSVYWFIGGTDPDTYRTLEADGRVNDIPTNHSPKFLPVIHPTLETGVEALIVAARTWLSK